MIEQRHGDWIKTYTGKKFYPLDPREEEIDIEDIAHALSNLCRFTGHCREFYSVAQHSCLAAKYASTIKEKRQALLHDASEVYLSDVSRPLKRCKEFSDYKIFESKLQTMIYKKFGVDLEMSKTIKEIDNNLLYTEGRDLMGGTHDWHDADGVILYEKIIPMTQIESKKWFLELFYKLF